MNKLLLIIIMVLAFSCKKGYDCQYIVMLNDSVEQIADGPQAHEPLCGYTLIHIDTLASGIEKTYRFCEFNK